MLHYIRHALTRNIFPTIGIFSFFTPVFSMSTPTRSFETLNIGGMPPTRRSQTQAHQQRAGRSAGGRSRGGSRRRGDNIDQSAPHIAVPVREVEAPIHGSSGLLYNIQNLSPGSSLRAVEGLASEFFVDRLKCYGLGSDAYYAFQLKKPVSVRIHDPASGARRVECTCDDYQQSRSICAHIYVSAAPGLGGKYLADLRSGSLMA